MTYPSDALAAEPLGAAAPHAPAAPHVRARRGVSQGLSKLVRGVRGAESGWPSESLLRARAPL